jgi:hypothetical protein
MMEMTDDQTPVGRLFHFFGVGQCGLGTTLSGEDLQPGISCLHGFALHAA